MKKEPVILITGVAGLAGSHLADYLIKKHFGKVVGVIRNDTGSDIVKHLNIEIRECDLTDPIGAERLIRQTKPDYLFHLAAESYVPASWNAPIYTMRNNIFPALHLFEAIRLNKLDTRNQLAGSSEEYGLIYAEELPIKETNQLRPLSPYGVSKVALDLLGWQYFKSYGMAIIRTRCFNHIGPHYHRPDASSDWARQIVAIEQSRQEPVIRVGNLKAKRDLMDVRDAVRAYWLAVTMGEPGEVYNIASDEAVTMQHVLDTLLSLTEIKIKVEIDPERLRPSDVEILLGDSNKFRKLTGWRPEIPLKETLKDVLDFWRAL